jgi:hypothetical protein
MESWRQDIIVDSSSRQVCSRIKRAVALQQRKFRACIWPSRPFNRLFILLLKTIFINSIQYHMQRAKVEREETNDSGARTAVGERNTHPIGRSCKIFVQYSDVYCIRTHLGLLRFRIDSQTHRLTMIKNRFFFEAMILLE